MRHVHIFDPQLFDQGGHYMNHDAQLVRELRRRGIPVSLYARQGCKVQCEGITPQPIFTSEIFRDAISDAQVWAIENFNNINQVFLGDLCRLNPDRFGPDDLIYFPNLIQNQLYAVAMWLARFPAERRPRIAVMLRYLNHAMDYIQARANKELVALYYRYAVRTLRAVQPCSLICSDTRELAATYQQLTGCAVLELPNPMDVSDRLAEMSERKPREHPGVVYQGHSSPLRGFHFLPEIIERSKKLYPNLSFIVQIQSREAAITNQMSAALEKLQQLSISGDVRLIHGVLSPTDYLNLLSEADIVLLPYSPTFYGHGSSGVFTEAASLGKVVVVSANTVPARQGNEFNLGVVAAPQWNAEAIAHALSVAVADLPAMQAMSDAGAERFRSENSARAFWDRLFTAIQVFPNEQAAAA